MKLECKLPKAVHLPLRKVLAEALRQTGCHSRSLLVTVNRTSRWGDYATGNAYHGTIGVYRTRTRKGRKLKSGKRKWHFRETRIDCDGHIVLTLRWPPGDPLTWAQALYKTALHEAAHIAQRHSFTREEKRTVRWADRPQEQEAMQVAHDCLLGMNPRRQDLLLDLALAVEEYVASR